MRFGSADSPELEGGVPYHVRIPREKAERYALLPGDPERVPKISEQWDWSEEVARHRQYVVNRGSYRGTGLLAVSTGIGSPAAAIAVEELARVGVDTLIRVGSTGAIQPEVELGDLVITSAAVRMEGTSDQYVIRGYPAHASYDVLLALIEAADSMGYRYHVGITATTDSFYTGQGRPGYGGYLQSWHAHLLDDLRAARVLNFEMESSAIFTLASIFGLRAGAVHAVFAQRNRNEFDVRGEEEAIRVANEAVRILSEWDSLKGKRRYLTPSMLSEWRGRSSAGDRHRDADG